MIGLDQRVAKLRIDCLRVHSDREILLHVLLEGGRGNLHKVQPEQEGAQVSLSSRCSVRHSRVAARVVGNAAADGHVYSQQPPRGGISPSAPLQRPLLRALVVLYFFCNA